MYAIRRRIAQLLLEKDELKIRTERTKTIRY